jgi:hypothetical protein
MPRVLVDLIQSEPNFNFTAKSLETEVCIGSEVIDYLRREPAKVGVVEREGKVPVVESNYWLETLGDERV